MPSSMQEGAPFWRRLLRSASMLAALRRGLQSTVLRPAAVAVATAGGAAVLVAAVRGLGSSRREDSDEGPRAKSDADWASTLTRDQFHVLRTGGTEHPFSGEYVQFSPAGGHFACAGCALPLYSAGSKFESSCGWPAFDKSVGGSVLVQTDFSLGRVRSEIVCAGCGGHLGRACTRSLQPERPGDPAVNSTDTTDAPAPLPGAAQTCLAAKPTRPRMSGIASTRWRCSMIGSHCLQGLRRSRS